MFWFKDRHLDFPTMLIELRMVESFDGSGRSSGHEARKLCGREGFSKNALSRSNTPVSTVGRLTTVFV